MLKRREFIKTSVVVATAASTGILTANAHGHDLSNSARTRIDFVLVDDEIEDSMLFARELIRRGAKAFSIQDDIGRLWFGELGAGFHAGASIAGLTTHTELLVCSTFARSSGARVRYEGSHDCRGGEVLTHSLHLGESNRGLSALLASAEAEWPRVLASHVDGLSASGAGACDERCVTTTRRSESNPGSLFSWVIA